MYPVLCVVLWSRVTFMDVGRWVSIIYLGFVCGQVVITYSSVCGQVVITSCFVCGQVVITNG